jgi:hypothetical protein
MARSLGMSKLLVLVNLMLVNRANSPPKRCSHPFSDSFVGEFSEVGSALALLRDNTLFRLTCEAR